MPASSRRAGRRPVVSAVLSLMLATCAALTTACSPAEIVCPAVMYFSTLSVTIEGAQAADVELCADGACVAEGDLSDTVVIVSSGSSGSTWTFTGTFPEDLSVRVLAADGSVLADAEVDPEWVRTGGSEECGGPTAASVTVTL